MADDSPGLLAQRMRTNRTQRLNKLHLEDILDPYRHRPGAQEWAGEHVGKFLDAATLAVEATPDSKLRSRIIEAARGLMATQLADGYLGTYAPAQRWTSWDVWSHKYNLLGLLAYHAWSGDAAALSACRRAADLLCKTFGSREGQLDIVAPAHSTHVGMASTSVLEPMVLLHRRTGARAYSEFADYILKAWEQPNGPHILSALTSHGSVVKTANGKAYEMLSNIVGLCELHRETGRADALQACTQAWRDIVANRHYVIGTTSWGEHFQPNGDLRADGAFEESKFVAAGEGCVTVTWLQLNWQLFRLTGELAYADVIERIAYNALIGAQDPDNGQIMYFSPLIGRKRYGEVNHGITPDICCCASSIPRGIAVLPQMMAGVLDGKATVVLYEPAQHVLSMQTSAGAQNVRLKVEGDYPLSGAVKITIAPSRPARFAVALRVPAWAQGFKAHIEGSSHEGQPEEWLVIDRTWSGNDQIDVHIPLAMRIRSTGAKDAGKFFVERGPQVLATDGNVTSLGRLPAWGWRGKQLYRFPLDGREHLLVPFADAGQTRADYSVVVG